MEMLVLIKVYCIQYIIIIQVQYFLSSGTIYVVNSLPAGERVYHLVIDAQDGDGQSALQRADVYISVTGPGSNPPIFEQRVYRFTIPEDVNDDTFVGIVRAKYAGSSDGTQFIILSLQIVLYIYLS